MRNTSTRSVAAGWSRSISAELTVQQILDLLIKGQSPGIKDEIVDLLKEEEIVRATGSA